MVDVWAKNGGSEKMYLLMDKATRFRKMGGTSRNKK